MLTYSEWYDEQARKYNSTLKEKANKHLRELFKNPRVMLHQQTGTKMMSLLYWYDKGLCDFKGLPDQIFLPTSIVYYEIDKGNWDNAKILIQKSIKDKKKHYQYMKSVIDSSNPIFVKEMMNYYLENFGKDNLDIKKLVDYTIRTSKSIDILKYLLTFTPKMSKKSLMNTLLYNDPEFIKVVIENGVNGLTYKDLIIPFNSKFRTLWYENLPTNLDSYYFNERIEIMKSLYDDFILGRDADPYNKKREYQEYCKRVPSSKNRCDRPKPEKLYLGSSNKYKNKFLYYTKDNYIDINTGLESIIKAKDFYKLLSLFYYFKNIITNRDRLSGYILYQIKNLDTPDKKIYGLFKVCTSNEYQPIKSKHPYMTILRLLGDKSQAIYQIKDAYFKDWN